MLKYPAVISIENPITVEAKDVWLPDFDLMHDRNILYMFYKAPNDPYYAGKTLRGRDRFRWHMRNTFTLETDHIDLMLDILPVQVDWIKGNNFGRFNSLHAVPLEYYESILIRAFRPQYNTNIKKTFQEYNKSRDWHYFDLSIYDRDAVAQFLHDQHAIRNDHPSLDESDILCEWCKLYVKNLVCCAVCHRIICRKHTLIRENDRLCAHCYYSTPQS